VLNKFWLEKGLLFWVTLFQAVVLKMQHRFFLQMAFSASSNVLSILLHPSKFVYNYILSNFVFINFLIFCLYMEKLETLVFCRLSRRPDHLFVLARFALLAWTKYRLTCGAAILI